MPCAGSPIDVICDDSNDSVFVSDELIGKLKRPMTAVYDNLGIRFLYPENWRITHEQASDAPYEVSIQTPGGGFWSIHVYSSSADPAELTTEALRSMRVEYDDLDSEPISEDVGVTEAIGYELNFYCLDMLVTARVLGLRTIDQTLLVMYQAESREFETMSRVFQAVTLSLLRRDLKAED